MNTTMTMPKLGEILDRESYAWLASNPLDVLEAIEAEVKAGRSPDDVRLFVILRTGRAELAVRCQAAARHVKAREAG